MLSPENPEPFRRKNKEKIVKILRGFLFKFFFKEIYLLSGSKIFFYFLPKKDNTSFTFQS